MAPRTVRRTRHADTRLRHLHTSQGVSGAIRKYAYKYSEGRAAHWLLLVAADRVDAWEHHLRSFATLRPDNPVTETGVLSEFPAVASAPGSGKSGLTSTTNGSTRWSSAAPGCWPDWGVL